MFGKKSLGFHCWDEKDEVILCGKGEHTTPKMAGKCVCFPTDWGRLSEPEGEERGSSARGLARPSLCLCFLFWLGLGSRTVTFLHLKLPFSSHLSTPDKMVHKGSTPPRAMLKIHVKSDL